jgi:plasmid stabilization system protein ParE
MAVESLDIHPSALAELKSAISWYLEQNEATANKFVAEVDRAIDLILGSPRRWPTGELQTRKFVLQRFPYAVIYREKQAEVKILAIAHGHRQPGYWKDRL